MDVMITQIPHKDTPHSTGFKTINYWLRMTWLNPKENKVKTANHMINLLILFSKTKVSSRNSTDPKD